MRFIEFKVLRVRTVRGGLGTRIENYTFFIMAFSDSLYESEEWDKPRKKSN